MHAKTHRVNSDFQIGYFLAGSCHTADGAYALLCDLREDRAMALEAALGHRRRWWQRQPHRVAAAVHASNVAGAEAELLTIQRFIDALQKHRKFAHLQDAQAHQAAQAEEWCLELIHRAENHLLTGSAIPVDQFATMRLHPQFVARILPAIEACRALAGPAERSKFLCQSNARKFSVPLALGSPEPA